MSEVTLEVLGCRCGIGGIAITPGTTSGGVRITGHKCTGEWTVKTAYRVRVAEIVRAIEDAAEDVEHAARVRLAKEKEKSK